MEQKYVKKVKELAGINQEKIVQLPIQRLRSFKDHPFKVTDDEQMEKLIASIKECGVLTPIIVRPLKDSSYEIISGHRRCHAAEQAGFYEVPAIIRSMADEDSIICMVDSNMQREHILPSEKAFAYKMKNDAMKRSAGRKKNGGHDDHDLIGKKTVDVIGQALGDSAKQVQRYIRLTFLIPELLQMVDDARLAVGPAVELSFLNATEQKNMIQAMDYTQAAPSLSQALRIKELSRNKCAGRDQMIAILAEVKKGETKRVAFKNEQLYRYFPKSYSVEQMQKAILEILEMYTKDMWD